MFNVIVGDRVVVLADKIGGVIVNVDKSMTKNTAFDTCEVVKDDGYIKKYHACELAREGSK